MAKTSAKFLESLDVNKKRVRSLMSGKLTNRLRQISTFSTNIVDKKEIIVILWACDSSINRRLTQ